jgi:hypothetical protein
MRKQTPMQFVDAYLTNLQTIVDKDTAKILLGIQENLQDFIQEETTLIKKAFIDGYESAIDAHSTKAEILAELYIKEKFK